MNAKAQAKLKADLEHALAEALALADDHNAYVLGKLETRLERREDHTVVIRFAWEVGTPRA